MQAAAGGEAVGTSTCAATWSCCSVLCVPSSFKPIHNIAELIKAIHRCAEIIIGASK